MATRIKGNLTFVSPPDLLVPHEEILTGRGDREVIDTGCTTHYGERIYIAPETVVDWARDLDLVPKSEVEAVKAELDAERQKKIEVEKVLKEALE